ncbi:MAG TPA: nuclear transport factor 2 family protein [Longimicrobiales bacterium]
MTRTRTLPRLALLISMLALAGCAARAQAPADARPGIDTVLDDFHAAAATGAADRYLAHFTDDGVFFGTDPAERWTKQQFEPYVRRAFANGGWTYVPRDRTTFLSDDGDVAWFDEMLDSPGGTVARGTGVLVREGGEWKVAQYNFSVPFPNSLWDTILEMIRDERD